MRPVRANQLHGAPYEMFKGRKIPASAWDHWKERWTPNWLRWLFPVSYRIVPNVLVDPQLFPGEWYIVNSPVSTNSEDWRGNFPNQLPITETQLNDRGEEDPSSSRS